MKKIRKEKGEGRIGRRAGKKIGKQHGEGKQAKKIGKDNPSAFSFC